MKAAPFLATALHAAIRPGFILWLRESSLSLRVVVQLNKAIKLHGSFPGEKRGESHYGSPLKRFGFESN